MGFLICLITLACLSMFTVKVATVVPDMTPFQKELTTNLFVTFENETQDYKPASIEDIMNLTRISLFNLRSYYGSYTEKLVGCYFTTVTYRSAMWDLRRYFEIRYLYVNTLEFEVGYLTHEIIYRYQLVLELYQMAERRFMPLQHQNIASTSYMLYIYTNILMHSKAIMHLCNMMHELERKYKKNKKQNVFDDFFISDKKKSESNDTPGLTEEELHKQWLERKRKQEKKRAKERKKYYKQMMKFGFATSTKRTSPKKGPFPLIYGWSIEDW